MIFDRLKKALGFEAEEKAVTLTDPEAYALFGVVPTSAGISVGPNTAMRVPAVACAVGLISETIGSMPVKLYDRTTKDALDTDPAYFLVHERANEWTSAHKLREQLTADALLYGAGHAQVIRSADGTPLELHRLPPGTVQRDCEPDGEPFYRVSTENQRVRLSFRDVLRIEAFCETSPITLAREAIALALQFQQHISGIFVNGGRPSGIIKAKKSVDAETKKKLAASWFASHGGNSAGGTALLDEEMDYQQLSMTLADTQFADNRLEQTNEIARVFRIPPTLLFNLQRATWSNTEQLFQQFHTVTLKPWLTDWQAAYAQCLLTPDEQRTSYFEFVTDDLLRTDSAGRAAAFSQYRSMGVMTANEVRAAQNLPPLEGGDELQNPFTSSGKGDAE